MQISKKVTKSGNITIPCMLRQETGILPGILVDVAADATGIRVVRHILACRFYETVEDVATACGMEVCRVCAGEVVEVFQ